MPRSPGRALARNCCASFIISCLIATSAAAFVDPPPALKKAGVLRVATDPTFPPMEMEDDKGALTGFDVDVAKLLAEHLHLRAQFQPMAWDGIIAGLQSKRYDMVISAMNITPDRQKNANFVEYLRVSQVFVGQPGAKITKVGDLAGKIVAVQADATSAYFVEKAKASGIAIKGIKEYRNTTDIFAAIRAGHANAMVIDEPVGRYFAKIDPEHFQVTGESRAPEPLGMALRKGDAELAQALTKAVAEIKADGSLAALTKKWFGI